MLVENKKVTYNSAALDASFIKEQKKLYEKDPRIWKGVDLIVKTYKKGKKVLICGNGGSNADSLHIAAELGGKYKLEREPLESYALSSNQPLFTAVSNDYDKDIGFEREVKEKGKKGDLLITISTSGNSINVINALKKAKEKGMKVMALLGKGGGNMKGMADLEYIVDSDDTDIVQVSHSLLYHTIIENVEKKLYPQNDRFQ